MPNSVSIQISGENLAGSAISTVRQDLQDLQGAAAGTTATMAQTQAALAAVDVEGGKLTSTMRLNSVSVAEAKAALDAMKGTLGDSSGQIGQMVEQLSSMQGAHTKVSLGVRQVDGDIKSLNATVRDAPATVTPWTAAVEHLAGAIPGLSEALHVGREATAASAEATRAASEAAEGGAGSLGMLAAAAPAAALGMAAVGVAVAASTVELSKMGAEWQHEETNIANAAAISVAQAHAIGSAFIDLSHEVPQGAMEISQAYEHVAGRLESYNGAALSTAQATEFMKTAAEGAVAGNQSLESATGALVQQMMASHSSIEDQGHVMDVLFNTSRVTGASYDEMSTIMGRLQARMGAAAPSIDDVGLAMDIMSKAGLSGARGMMVVTQMLEQLADPSDKAAANLKAFGIEIQHNADGSLNLKGSLEGLTTAFARIDDPVQRHALAVELVGKQYAGVFESALKQATGRVSEMSAEISASNTAHEAAEKHAADLQEKMDKLGNSVHGVALELGGGLAGALSGVGQAFSDFGTKIDHLPDPAKMALGLIPRIAVGAIPGIGTGAAFAMGMTGGGAETAPLAGGPPSRDTYAGEAHTAAALDELTARYTAPLTGAAIRQAAEGMRGLSSEANNMNKEMAAINQAALPADIAAHLKTLNEAEVQQEESWRRAFDPAHPEQAAQRVATLHDLTLQYNAAVNDPATREAVAGRIDAYERQVKSEDDAADAAKRTATYQREQANEAKRLADEQERQRKAAEQADVGTGLAQAMGKGLAGADMKRDLDPAAAKVMDDFMAAVEAQGTSRAADAGKALGGAIVGIGEELRKSGAGDWQETMARMFDVSEAIRRGEPGAVDAMHQLAAHASEEIDQAKIDVAWDKQLQGADRTIAQGEQRLTNTRTDAANKRADSLAGLAQQEADRIGDVQARAGADADVRAEQHRLDNQRGQERADREDEDRADQHGRALADLAERNGRSMNDLSIRAQESESQTLRHAQEQRQEAAISHEQRLRDIQTKGGPGVAAAVADENRRYAEDQARTSRQEQTAAADRQAQLAQSQQDATRRQAEAVADLAKRERESETDRAKQRGRAEQDKAAQEHDQDAMAQARVDAEKRHGIDPETLAHRHLVEQTTRIDQQYAHELQTSQRTLDQQKAATVEKLGSGYAELQRQYPWLADLGVAMPSSMMPNTNPFGGTGFFPVEHHAEGGQFTVPGSPGEGDNHMVQFMATPGETVSIRPGSVGGGLNQAAPGMHDFAQGTALGATGSFGAAAQAQYPGTDWNAPHTSSAPWAQSGLPPSVRYGDGNTAGSYGQVTAQQEVAGAAKLAGGAGDKAPEVHLHFDNATMLGDVGPQTARKLMDLIAPELNTWFRTMALVGGAH